MFKTGEGEKEWVKLIIATSISTVAFIFNSYFHTKM